MGLSVIYCSIYSNKSFSLLLLFYYCYFNNATSGEFYLSFWILLFFYYIERVRVIRFPSFIYIATLLLAARACLHIIIVSTSLISIRSLFVASALSPFPLLENVLFLLSSASNESSFKLYLIILSDCIAWVSPDFLSDFRSIDWTWALPCKELL